MSAEQLLFLSIVFATVAGPHHKDSHRRGKRRRLAHGVIDAFEPVVVPLFAPSELVGNRRIAAKVDLPMCVARLRAVNPRPHDQIYRAAQPVAERRVRRGGVAPHESYHPPTR